MDDLQKTCKRPHLTKEERLPRCYKDTEKIIKSAKSCKSNFKTALANSRLRGSNFKKVYNLSLNVLKQYDYIQKIIEEIKLLDKEKFFRRELASILIYEMLFGHGFLAGKSKPENTINKYRDDIMYAHQNLQYCYIDPIPGFTIPRYVRVHTLVTTVDYVIKDLEYLGFKKVMYNESISEEEYMNILKNINKGHFVVDFHFKDILAFAHNENLCDLKLYNDGHIFLQDKSSYIPVHVLNPEPGSVVLDACAAPGMKSIHIASKMKNKGTLIACEKDQTRFKTLQEMIQYGAVKISKLHCTDFRLIDPLDPAYSSLNCILLDPSCSGSGMVNRMDEVTDTEDSKNKDRLQKLAGFQIVLLKHALKFPSVKRVVYSTCSVHEEENEYVVHEALNAFNRSFRLVPAMPDWTERGKDSFEYGKLCLRAVTKKHLTNGFFVAVFDRLNYDNKQNLYVKDRMLENNTACDGQDERSNKNGYNFSSKKGKRKNSRNEEFNENSQCNNYSDMTQKKDQTNSLEDMDNFNNCEEKQDCRYTSHESKNFEKCENTMMNKKGDRQYNYKSLDMPFEKKKKHKHDEIEQVNIGNAEPKRKKHKHDEIEQVNIGDAEPKKKNHKHDEIEKENFGDAEPKRKKKKHKHDEIEQENIGDSEPKRKNKKKKYDHDKTKQEAFVEVLSGKKKNDRNKHGCNEVKQEEIGVSSDKYKKYKEIKCKYDEGEGAFIDILSEREKCKNDIKEYNEDGKQALEILPRKKKKDKKKRYESIGINQEVVEVLLETKEKDNRTMYDEVNQENVSILSEKMKKHEPSYVCDEAKQEGMLSSHRKKRGKTTKYEFNEIKEEVVEALSKKNKKHNSKYVCDVEVKQELVSCEGTKKDKSTKYKCDKIQQKIMDSSSEERQNDKMTKSDCNVVMQGEFVNVALKNKGKQRKYKYNEENQGEPVSCAPSTSKEYKTEPSVQNELQLGETKAELFMSEHKKHKKHKKHKR